jgi:4-alpha-glucanotransferase
MSDKGILLHITSLPSPYGIGTFGRCAYKFADRLAEKGYKYWQILPLCPTGFRDSPYQSFSSFAGNPYLIDLDMLCKKRLLRHSEIDSINWGKDPSHVDFGTIYEKRFPLLLRMSSRFDFSDPLYIDFCESNREWLDDYAVFMAMKKFVGGEPWYNWDRRVRFRDPSYMHKLMGVFSSEIRFWKMIQYLFYEQWYELKAHVNSLGIQIIGDMPLYVALDSADVWSRPEKFLLNDQLEPTALAGCPPDSFSKDGQMWGNPIYDWPHMKDHEYECKRLAELGVGILLEHELVSVRLGNGRRHVTLRHLLTGRELATTHDHVVVEHGTVPVSDLFDELRPLSSNDGVTELDSLIGPAPLRVQPAARLELHRIGDAVSSRSVHAAMLDALRLCVQF